MAQQSKQKQAATKAEAWKKSVKCHLIKYQVTTTQTTTTSTTSISAQQMVHFIDKDASGDKIRLITGDYSIMNRATTHHTHACEKQNLGPTTHPHTHTRRHALPPIHTVSLETCAETWLKKFPLYLANELCSSIEGKAIKSSQLPANKLISCLPRHYSHIKDCQIVFE